MTLRFRCEDCQIRVKVPDGSKGRKVKCPRCGLTQRVPTEAKSDQQAIAIAEETPNPVEGVSPGTDTMTQASDHGVPSSTVEAATRDSREHELDDVTERGDAFNHDEDHAGEYEANPLAALATAAEGGPSATAMAMALQDALKGTPTHEVDNSDSGTIRLGNHQQIDENEKADNLQSMDPHLSVVPDSDSTDAEASSTVVDDSSAIGDTNDTGSPLSPPRFRTPGKHGGSLSSVPHASRKSHPKVLSKEALVSRQTAKPTPLPDQPATVNLRNNQQGASPAYRALAAITWLLRLSAVLVLGCAGVLLMEAIDLAAAWSTSLAIITGGVVIAGVVWALGELANAVRDVARNSFR